MGDRAIAKAVQWQPITGCSKYSAGCANCKTTHLASEALRQEFQRDGLVKSDGKWTGQVRFSEERLNLPFENPRGSIVLVCPHGDLFHESVPTGWIDRVFDVMELASHCTFQILTKRSARQADYFGSRYDSVAPPPRILAGVSVEDEETASERIPDLLRTKAGAIYLSVYPVLSAIDIEPFLGGRRLSVVGAGVEPERPAKPEWIASLRQACARSKTPFVFSSDLVGAE